MGRFGLGEGPGTIQASFNGAAAEGTVVDSDRRDFSPVDTLDQATLEELSQVLPNQPVRTIRLSHYGAYRVAAAPTEAGGVTVAGRPLSEVRESGRRILWVGLNLAVLSGIAAGLIGAWLVRRQLRPLREVAQTAGVVARQDLASGTGEVTARVPTQYTDPETQVGQVGYALNALLSSMEDALGVRHRSEEQVRQFVADASHELRTPVTAIQGYSELAARSDDVEFLRDAAAKMGIQASRMAGLVDDLLLLARIDAGRPLARAEVDVARLAAEEVEQASLLDPERRYELSVPTAEALVPGDELRLRQVLTNVLINARRYTPAGTRVQVVIAKKGPHVVLTITDDGPGMSPDFVPIAFDRFSRGDEGRSREAGGSGLGLAIVKAIIDAHGGQVHLVSEPGYTCFTVTL
jgi:two-component system, OmpR family, sensor kinase